MTTPSSSTANPSTKHISLPSIFSEGDPATEWFKRYEICCNVNDWGDELKVKKLPTLLEGEALVTWLELTSEQQSNYTASKTKILERMGPVRFVSMDDFHRRRLLPGESLSVFSHELKRLIDQAMPTADAATRQQLLIHQFLTGMPTEVSKRLRASGEIDDLGQLIQRAKLLMTIDAKEKPEEKSAAVQQPIDRVEALTEQVAALTEQIATITANQRNACQSARLLVCFWCNQPGHVQRNCPKSRQCYMYGRIGHFARDCCQGNGQGVPRTSWGRP